MRIVDQVVPFWALVCWEYADHERWELRYDTDEVDLELLTGLLTLIPEGSELEIPPALDARDGRLMGFANEHMTAYIVKTPMIVRHDA